jgi:tetratricopeptide (TPR) repeat protein
MAERASVIGRSFEQAALSDMLTPGERGGMVRSLLGLVRKDLIRPDHSEVSAGDAFRFRHVLIRDAAYELLPKAERAELHERFGDWLERVTGERIAEYAEIVGYHLEQAAGYHASLGTGGDRTANLRARAAERLLAAGIRAIDRSDRSSAVGLLERAVTLLDEGDERRARAQLELGEAYAELGEEERAAQLAAAVLAGANEPPAVKARAHILSVLAHRSSDPAFMNKLATVAAEALPDFQAAEDHEMIATAYQHLAWTANDAGEVDVRAPLTMALEHAVASGRPGIINGIRGAQLLYGSLVGDGRAYIPGCLAVINDPGAPFELRGSALDTVGPIEAAAGDLGAGRAHLAQAVALFDEIQSPAGRSASRVDAGWIELWAGDPVAAERWFREAVPLADEHTKPYARARLGLALVDQDRLADAREIADELELARGTDWLDDLMTSRVQAGIRQHEGHAEEAMALLRTAVDAMPQAITFSRAEALLQLSQCAAAAHAVPEAIESAREAHRLFSERGATYLADAAARLLDGLGASADG